MLGTGRPSLLSFAAMTVVLGACAIDESPWHAEVTSALGQPVTASIHGWTISSVVQHGPVAGNVRSVITFDDNGLGGARNGGTCLVADLDLGACDAVQDCLDAAAAAGLPGQGGVPGWSHYCQSTGREDSPRHESSRRCWSRPGAQSQFCSLGQGHLPGATRSVERSVTGIPGLPSIPRRWTSISCLTGGTAADGSIVGNPSGCGQAATRAYAVDDPLNVPGH